MNKILLAAIGISIVSPLFSIDPPKKRVKKLSKQSQNFVDNLVVFDEGTITSGRSIGNLKPTEKDTALLFHSIPKRVSHSHFAMSKFEVSNADYHLFELYVHDSIRRTELSKQDAKYLLPDSKLLDWSVPLEERDVSRILMEGKYDYRYVKDGKELSLTISPDQEVWTKDFTYSYNEPMKNMYYWHPAYDNYPVVGISAEQAEAYCHWYTKEFRKSLSPDQKELFKGKSFRLPSSVEWESAAIDKTNDIHTNNVFAWQGGAMGIQGNYGAIVDENNYNLKYFSGDGGFHTVKVDSYVAGSNGIHNMSGNVCEWTSTEARDTIFYGEQYFLPGEPLNSIEKKMRKQIPEENDKGFTERKIKEYSALIHHDCIILSKYKEGVYVKGGSWADPLIYSMIDKKEVYLKDHQSSRIGFRLAMDVDEDLADFLD